MHESIFHRYYGEQPEFVDRFERGAEQPVDVIIPTFNTNELWQANLLSIYREIPVNRLLIGDGGCTDETIGTARAFPRAVILNQQHRHSLGYCLRELIAAVETEWFVYLHSDVFLPEGWFEAMSAHCTEYDWFECFRKATTLFESTMENENRADRPYSGSQMGRTAAFEGFIDQIDDDYLYRNEDLIIAWLVENGGGRYGRIKDTYHYHQIMNKHGEKEPKLASISITKTRQRDWEIRTFDMQLRGLIKYTSPTKPYLVQAARAALRVLHELDAVDFDELLEWTRETNSHWLEHLGRWVGDYKHPKRNAFFQRLARLKRRLGRLMARLKP